MTCRGPPLRCCLELVQRGGELRKTAAHAWQELEPLGGELHAPAPAREQRHLQVLLQAADVLADRGRRYVQCISGLTEIEPRGHGLEDPQGVQRQAVGGGWHVKFSLIEQQTLRLLLSRRQERLRASG